MKVSLTTPELVVLHQHLNGFQVNSDQAILVYDIQTRTEDALRDLPPIEQTHCPTYYSEMDGPRAVPLDRLNSLPTALFDRLDGENAIELSGAEHAFLVERYNDPNAKWPSNNLFLRAFVPMLRKIKNAS